MRKWHNDMFYISVVKQFTISWSVVDEVILKNSMYKLHNFYMYNTIK